MQQPDRAEVSPTTVRSETRRAPGGRGRQESNEALRAPDSGGEPRAERELATDTDAVARMVYEGCPHDQDSG